MEARKTNILFIMGVSGCGKSTVGKLLASHLELPFFDGDDFHPPENITKMESGIPLEDEDRFGWLVTLNQLAKKHQHKGVVIACSALKQSYRDALIQGIENQTHFVYLEGSFEIINSRISQRKDHFMPVDLLKSQFDTLEPPLNAITISVQEKPEQLIQQIVSKLN